MLLEGSRSRYATGIFLLLWLLSVAYAAVTLQRGWIPYDDGALGQAAERLLHGEIPHRDFIDPYTGGLAFLDALVFKICGAKLIWLRLPLFLVFVLWIPAVYTIARQFLNSLASAGVTLVSVAWSIPNYPAAMPSWFNMYLATFGLLALVKYIRKPAVRWLVLAGLAGGCSFLFKSVGLYFIFAVLLFFVFREQSLSRMTGGPPQRTLVYLAFLTICLALFIVALFKLVINVAEPSDFLHFVFPSFAIAVLLLARERTSSCLPSLARFRSLFQMAFPFLLSAAIPIALFLAYYWRHHAVSALLHGVFVGPLLRVYYSRKPPPDVLTEFPALIALLFFVEAASLKERIRSFLSIILLIGATLVLLTCRRIELSYLVALETVLGSIPVITAAAVLFLYRKTLSDESKSDQILLLLLTAVALCSLIQFPFSQTMYFCYVSVFVILLAACLVSRFTSPPRAIITGSICFYTLFAIFVLRPGYLSAWHNRDYDRAFIGQTRAGNLRVSTADAEQYRALIPFVKRLSEGKPIFAGPDAPEVSFLAELNNPTRFLFDSIEDPVAYERSVKSLLGESGSIKVAVVKDVFDPSTSHLLIIRRVVANSFPNSQRIGKFTVYWRP